ncbi:MAG: hemolysin family protein [Bacilli bacterium]
MENIPPYLSWLIIAVCTILSAIFSASENTFSNCNRYHFEALANEGKRTAKIICKLSKRFDDTLVVALVGSNTCQVIMSNVSAFFFLNLANNGVINQNTESLLSILVLTIIVYIFVDTIPKVVSKALPNQLAMVFAYIIIFFYYLFYPLILVFRGIIYLSKKIFKTKGDLSITKEEFIEKADDAIDDGVLEEDEKNILSRAFVFDTISVDKVLTKKKDIFEIDYNGLTVNKLNKIILSTSYSRIPIYKNNPDNIIGIITVRTYFKEYTKDEHLDLRSVISKPLKVKDTDKVDDIFKKFNDAKTHIALVYNSKKELIGMITMEDILEELVGDINENKGKKLIGGDK